MKGDSAMKKMILLLLAFCCAATLEGRIAMKLETNRSTYMHYEKIFARLTMRNDSGQTLVFGKDSRLQGEILFELKDAEGKRIDAVRSEYVPEGLILRPGEVREVVLPLSRMYKLDRTGTVRGFAYIRHPILKEEFRSNDCVIFIKNGVPVWTRTVGMPDFAGTENNKKIEERTYKICVLTDETSRYYYLFVEDEKQIYAVVRIGREIGMEQIHKEVDGFSNLHLLIPISPRISRYISVDCKGRLMHESYVKTTATIPQLVKDPANGIVKLIGGAEALAGVDFDDGRGNQNKLDVRR